MKYSAILLFLISSFFVINMAWGQCDGDIVLDTQEDVDNFVSDYGCTVVEGNLIIGSDPSPDYQSDITNLLGLSDIVSVEGSLNIINCDLLTELTDLESITQVGGNLKIFSNFLLTDLSALSKITFLGGNLEISVNHALTQLTDFSNITSVKGDLRIWGNYILTDITGLSSITSVEGDLGIGYNFLLTDLDVLSDITFVGNDLKIIGNDLLSDISSLSKILVVEGDLEVRANLDLSICCVLPDLISITEGETYIYDNAIGCNSVDEIVEICAMGLNQSLYEEKQNIIRLFPNPNQGQFVLQNKSNEAFYYKIYNTLGQLIIKQKTTSHYEEIMLAEAGLYVVMVETENGVWVEKMVVK